MLNPCLVKKLWRGEVKIFVHFPLSLILREMKTFYCFRMFTIWFRIFIVLSSCFKNRLLHFLSWLGAFWYCVHSFETSCCVIYKRLNKIKSPILFVILFFILLLFSKVLDIMILKISLAEPQGMLSICLIFLEIWASVCL